MSVRAWRAALAACVVASAQLAMAQVIDESTADVWYYAAKEPRRSGVELSSAFEPEAIDSDGDGYIGPNSSQYVSSDEGVYSNSHDDENWGEASCNDCNPCVPCARSRRWWGQAEYLGWWMRGGSAPPLVTTSPPGTLEPDAGVLPDATILFPTHDLGSSGRPGGRYALGYWLDREERYAIEGSYFFLAEGSDAFSASGDGSPILARPFINSQTGFEDAARISFPGEVTGAITVVATSEVQGAEANFRGAIGRGPKRRLDFIAGYRFLRVDEMLGVFDVYTQADDTVNHTSDIFRTRNEFNGGQIGLRYEKQFRRCSFDWVAKVALGNMHQFIDIRGAATITPSGGPTSSYNEGFLALDSNSGRYERDRFVAIPEFGVNLRYELTPTWRLNVGYTFILLSSIVRPGDNVDRRLDPDQFPPPIGTGTFPEFNFVQSNAWLQGGNVGLECRF